MKIENIKGIADISGFGKNTPYEGACQNMLQAGYEWLVNNKDKLKKLKGYTYQGLYGIFEPDSPAAKELSKAVVAGCNDCTGAMHQVVMVHLFYIAKNGIGKWKIQVTKMERGPKCNKKK